MNDEIKKEKESLVEANELLGRLRRIFKVPRDIEWGVSIDSLDEMHLCVQARYGALTFESEALEEKQ